MHFEGAEGGAGKTCITSKKGCVSNVFIRLGYQSIGYLLFFISQISILNINNLDFIDFVRKISLRLKKQKENKYQSEKKTK